MNTLTHEKQYSQARQEYGKVTKQNGFIFSVRTPTGTYQVKRSFSCLVEPILQDDVLISLNNFLGGYILTVLEREQDQTTNLQFENDVTITLNQGRLAISGEGVDLACSEDINVVSPQFNLTAREGNISMQHLSFWGTKLHAQIDKVMLLAQNLDAYLKRFFRKSDNSYRQTTGLDITKSGQVQLEAEETLQLRGEVTQMTAREDVHIDGQRVHIG